MSAAMGCHVAPMDIHHQNDEHDVQYRLAKTRYPTGESNDEFELFVCPYDPLHKINSKRWRYHLDRCKKNYGGRFRKCPFNASHHLPEPELDYHTINCPDRNIIRQDLEGGRSTWKMATTVDHNPEWQQPEATEDWDNEVDEDAGEFYLNPDKGMPLSLRPQQQQQQQTSEQYYVEEYDGENYYGEGNYEEEDYEGNKQTEENHYEEQQQQIKSVLEEELIPEKPPNWNNMSKTQKKNHRRKYDRQQQRMKEEGVTEEQFNRILAPDEMTEEQRNEKLAAIKVAYPLNNEKQNAERADYTSLLNIVCQKIRLNLPEYVPISAVNGGFAFKVRVFQTWYEGKEFCSTKKDAKHAAAKWALLGMEIPGIGGTPHPSSRPKPVHPRLLAQSKELREADEVGKLIAAGHYQQARKPNTVPLRQPNIQLGNQTQTSQSRKPQQQDVQPQQPYQWQQQQQLSQPQLQNQNQQEQRCQQQQMRQQTQQYQRQQPQPQQSAVQWNGWVSKQNTQTQPQKPHQQSQKPTQQAPWQAMENLDIQNGKDFPTLGDSSGKTVSPKKPSGVKQNVKGRGRGRGRATGMKLYNNS